MAGLVWTVTPADALSALAANYVARIEQGVVAIADYYSPQIMEYMKREHVWQNRTTAAELGLYTEVRHMAGQMVEIVLSHGDDVAYGIYLEGFTPSGQETRQGGRFAIIAPAIDAWAPHVWGAVVRMLR